MNDPYVTLGVSRTAGDEEIKKAYRELARKYHPDNYVDNPLADLAQEKMKEVNEAYELIQKERSYGGGAQTQYGSYSAQQNYSSSTGYASGASRGAYADARAAINSGDLQRAEMILGSITDRGAEWNYLMGSLSYRRGWMDAAARYFNTAVSMEPGNPEYRQAQSFMNSGAQSPYRTSGSGMSGVDPCDVCGKLVLADCCCEMMGGDFIRCI